MTAIYDYCHDGCCEKSLISDFIVMIKKSEEICVWGAVECRWMHMDRERGKGVGAGVGGESMRDLGKRRRHGLGG